MQQQYNENCPTSQWHGHFSTNIYEYSTAVKMNKLQPYITNKQNVKGTKVTK